MSEVKKHRNTALEWIWKVSGKKKINIVFLLFVQAVLGVSGVCFAYLLRGMIDCAVAGESYGFGFFAVLLVGLTIMQLVFRAVLRYLVEETKSSMENCFKERLFSTLLKRNFASVAAVHTGEWMNRLTSDVVVVADGVSTILPDVTGMLMQMAGALVLILVLIPGAAWILIPGGICMIFLTYGFRKVLKKLHKQIQEADGALRVFMQERLGSLLVIRSFAREQHVMEEAVQKMEGHKAARMKRNRFSNACNVGFGTMMRGSYVLGALYCGYGIMRGTLSYGTFTAVLQLIGQIQSPFANITGYLPKFYAMLASAERLMEAETFADDSAQEIMELEEIRGFYEKDFRAMGLKDAAFSYLPPVSGGSSEAIDSHRKTKMPIVLRGANLEIRRGDYVAFCGLSGSGKSTLLKLLMCLYPLDEGIRYVKTKTGDEVLLTRQYQRLFAYVPQGNHLMSGTIREIVAFSDKGRMQEEDALWRALEIACAADFVRELKDGVDTLLGERGMGLSEGQMQRISIARAIFSDNPVLMLDEATSALDEETESLLIKNLRSMTDKTVLIVTHRPAALAICDRQVVMSEDGISVAEKEV